MSSILNITNGDVAVKIMREAGIPGEFLPWRDVLHDGPVPQALSFDQLSEIRAQFIIEQGWGEHIEIRKSFVERDNMLKSFNDYEKVILWFEHDLYDQLQILQILDWFSKASNTHTALSMICTDQYLGMCTPEQMNSLFQYEEPVTQGHLALAQKSWAAFRSCTPQKWQDLLKSDTSMFPFLNGAIIRMLEEYPNKLNGLSRTAHQALHIINQGEKRPGRVFGLYQESEERRFLGDSSFWIILDAFLESKPPLLSMPEGRRLSLPTNPEQELSITAMGKRILEGEENWLDVIEIDRWIGGVHLTPDNIWCWDSASCTLIKDPG